MLEIRYNTNTREVTGWWATRHGNHEVKLKNRPDEVIVLLDIPIPEKPCNAYLYDEATQNLIPNPDYVQPNNENTPSNVTLKSGISTGPYGEEKQVDFDTPFPSTPNVVIASTTGKLVGVIEVTTTYFKWKDWQYSGEMTVHWIATDKGNW